MLPVHAKYFSQSKKKDIQIFSPQLAYSGVTKISLICKKSDKVNLKEKFGLFPVCEECVEYCSKHY